MKIYLTKTNHFLTVLSQPRPLDVAILLDWSSSFTTSQWNYILTYLRDYIQGLKISSDARGARVALIGYSSDARIVFDFNFGQAMADVYRRIASIRQQAGYRSPRSALLLARTLFSTANGARIGSRRVMLSLNLYFTPSHQCSLCIFVFSANINLVIKLLALFCKLKSENVDQFRQDYQIAYTKELY